LVDGRRTRYSIYTRKDHGCHLFPSFTKQYYDDSTLRYPSHCSDPMRHLTLSNCYSARFHLVRCCTGIITRQLLLAPWPVNPWSFTRTHFRFEGAKEPLKRVNFSEFTQKIPRSFDSNREIDHCQRINPNPPTLTTPFQLFIWAGELTMLLRSRTGTLAHRSRRKPQHFSIYDKGPFPPVFAVPRPTLDLWTIKERAVVLSYHQTCGASLALPLACLSSGRCFLLPLVSIM